MYPSLVNNTTIDWFHEWPADALQEVATRFLEDIKFPSRGTMFTGVHVCMCAPVAISSQCVICICVSSSY